MTKAAAQGAPSATDAERAAEDDRGADRELLDRSSRARSQACRFRYAAPYEPPRDPGPEQHIDVQRPGELVIPADIVYRARKMEAR